MESNQSWKELSKHKAPTTASISHASWVVDEGSFINFEPILPSIYNLPLDSVQFDPLRGEFTCDKHCFLLISVQRLSSAKNEGSNKIFLDFRNESVAGRDYSDCYEIEEFFGNFGHYLEEENHQFDIKNHEEYDMTRNFIAKVMQAEKMPKRTAKIGLTKLQLLIPRSRNDRLTKSQYRAFFAKDGIFTRGHDPAVFKEFCKERQREYDEAKASNEKMEAEEEMNRGAAGFARLFKVTKGTKIRLVLERASQAAVLNNARSTSIKNHNEVILWSLAVVQEAFISESDAAKLKLKKSFVHCQNFCCFKCGKRVATASGFAQHFRSHDSPTKDHIRIKNVACTVRGCNKKFTTEEAMRSHVKFYRHAKCATCNVRVKDELALQMHYKVKHDRQYMKNIYVYHRSKYTYYVHSRVGKVCNICDAAFAQPEDKLQHMKDYKHYQCEVCGKSFMREGNLHKHVRCKHPLYYQQHLHEAPNKKAKRLAHMRTEADVDEKNCS